MKIMNCTLNGQEGLSLFPEGIEEAIDLGMILSTVKMNGGEFHQVPLLPRINDKVGYFIPIKIPKKEQF